MTKIAACILSISLLFSVGKVRAVPDYWNHSAYAIQCTNTSVRDVLNDFVRNFGVSLIVSGQINGYCNDWTRADSATAFLDLLGNRYNFQWFVYKGNLYVSPNTDSITRRLDASRGFKEALNGLGLYQEKFGWGDLEDENVVLVTGPRRYVNLIAEFTEQQTEARRRVENGDVHVFNLKYAPVNDREIMIRSKEVTVPGVSTILKSLLENKKSIERDDPDSSSDILKRGSGGVGEGNVYVEADIRTNSILIRAPEKDYAFYKEIIDDLDVPSDLIEIDAIIVDINREKLKQLGANFTHVGTDVQITAGSTESNFGNLFLSEALSANATILIDNLGEFYSSLQALEGKGDASIIANTSILTMNNQPAVIDLSETVFIQSVGERVVDVREVTAGTLLNVVPQKMDTYDGNKIKLLIDIEDGRLGYSELDTATPSIQKTTINTKAIIDQNRSLVIGGYHMRSSVNEHSGVPVLKDIPVLGKLFSSSYEHNTHTERLFILTPRVSPTYHNPEDYSSTGNSELITAALDRVRSRWDNANRSYVQKTQRLLADLASGVVPNGYKLSATKEKDVRFSCNQDGVSFIFKGGQKVLGRGITAYIGVAVNTSGHTLMVDESSCRGKGLVGVSLFPDVTLYPEDRTEIFMAFESVRMDEATEIRDSKI